MFNFLRRQVRIAHSLGHRDYVGGMWDEIGKIQFDFLRSRGLTPKNVLLDVACGSLRLGAFAIPYLNEGNYLGFDNNRQLIDAGIKRELGRRIFRTKKPEFVVSSSFDFGQFSKVPDLAIIHALFMNVSDEVATACLKNLRTAFPELRSIYASFIETTQSEKTILDHYPFFSYGRSRHDMATLGESANWQLDYLGQFNHPRNHVMVRYYAV